ncbi:MAG: signal peptidase II [Solobacterium sp.]|nr:signal peptidase II [Solobacterium sp.]
MEFIWIVILMVIDQVSKFVIAADPVRYSHMEIIPGFFYLTFVKNTGAAWSMLAGQRALLSLIAAGAILAMAMILKNARKKHNVLLSVAMVLMISGAAGNLIDRLMFGYVRDFLHFYPFGYDFPVFNFADMCLCVGVGILILSTILEKDEEEVPEKKRGAKDSTRVIEPEVIRPEDDDEESWNEAEEAGARRKSGDEEVIEPEIIEPEKDRTGVD